MFLGDTFNGRLRDALLNATLFRSLPHARLALAAWRDDFNWLTPANYAARWTEKQELEVRRLGAFDDDATPDPAG
jgi:putative transposase